MQTPEQTSSIDILQWIDQLEALLTEGWRLPFSARVVVDEHAVFEIIDQMRIRIPEELKQARRIQQQQERIIAQAKEEANRIKAQARQEAEAALSQHEQVVVAQAKAEQILERARSEAEALRQEADQYALQVLRELEAALEASLRQVRNGIKKISSRQFEAGEALDSDTD
jgi:dsDNA-specific endonuclease/ATPase MutS2